MRNPFYLIAALISVCHFCRADAVDDLIHGEMAKRRIPGVVVKIVQDGRDVKMATYGLANLELNVAMTANSVFEIGSITKQFTAACILLLQQEGKLSVEDKISKHLANTPAAWSNVTIRHLLSHTSGIKSYTGLDGFELTRRLTQAEFLRKLGAQPLEFAPGEAWKYSNSGFSLLGYIVENGGWKSYWSFLRERILEPLAMNSTTDRKPGSLITNRVSGYEQTNRLHINRDYDLTDVFSAGAIASTIGDLAKWNAALDTERILSETTKKAAWSPHILNGGKPTQYGYGWFLETVDGHRIVGHGGSTSGFNASLQRFPDDQLAVIILTNTDEMVATGIARKIAALYFKPAKSR
ncbi:MAG: class A beta-lactamase-related serine hydrolase [Pedosphaera sp.]|nr:class A beta-lactamase-related serine hydrolase [Pedosphaera sp.]